MVQIVPNTIAFVIPGPDPRNATYENVRNGMARGERGPRRYDTGDFYKIPPTLFHYITLSLYH